MTRWSRIRTGGRADFTVEVETVAELTEVARFCREAGLPWYVLGRGSNVILSDEFFSGVVIRMKGDFEAITIESGRVVAGGGASLMRLGMSLASNGWRGFSFMAVIPGSVGGAVAMNAGTAEGEIKDRLESAEVLDPIGLELKTYGPEDMRFGYRQSRLLKSPLILVRATFRLEGRPEPGDRATALREVKELQARRLAKQPHHPRTFGSTFKKPAEGKPAGWYLEQVGMKGLRVGGAMTTLEHANWIVNTGGAASADFKEMIRIGQSRVKDRFGVELEREVIYLPEDLDRD